MAKKWKWNSSKKILGNTVFHTATCIVLALFYKYLYIINPDRFSPSPWDWLGVLIILLFGFSIQYIGWKEVVQYRINTYGYNVEFPYKYYGQLQQLSHDTLISIERQLLENNIHYNKQVTIQTTLKKSLIATITVNPEDIAIFIIHFRGPIEIRVRIHNESQDNYFKMKLKDILGKGIQEVEMRYGILK